MDGTMQCCDKKLRTPSRNNKIACSIESATYFNGLTHPKNGEGLPLSVVRGPAPRRQRSCRTSLSTSGHQAALAVETARDGGHTSSTQSRRSAQFGQGASRGPAPSPIGLGAVP